MHTQSESFSPSDAALLDMLTSDNFLPASKAKAGSGKHIEDPITVVDLPKAFAPTPSTAPRPAVKAFARRDAALDPLLLAAAFASGPDVTRNHYSHDFFPGVQLPVSEGSFNWAKYSPPDGSALRQVQEEGPKRMRYVSKQMPRSQRMAHELEHAPAPSAPLSVHLQNMPVQKPRRSSVTKTNGIDTFAHVPQAAPIEVKCMARTRIPTPYGPVFLHLYHNSKDQKEHLALVVDGNQSDGVESDVPHIRSTTLDAVWDPNESELDRLIRGAYVGKLSAHEAKASTPHHASSSSSSSSASLSPPLIRLHSECFTGETIGSMRCDCGEQLAEALRLISSTPDRRGVIVYLRQEGRGIGLLNKIKAYNLQDLGADTVLANELLGFGADERGYEVVGGILRDLGLAPRDAADTAKGVRLLTNNPEKVSALEGEGVRIVERVGMVPRSWQDRDGAVQSLAHAYKAAPHAHAAVVPQGGILGASSPYGVDLDKYLRTKVEKMGHILPKLWQ